MWWTPQKSFLTCMNQILLTIKNLKLICCTDLFTCFAWQVYVIECLNCQCNEDENNICIVYIIKLYVTFHCLCSMYEIEQGCIIIIVFEISLHVICFIEKKEYILVLFVYWFKHGRDTQICMHCVTVILIVIVFRIEVYMHDMLYWFTSIGRLKQHNFMMSFI